MSGFLHPFPSQYHNDGDTFCDCFYQALEANKRGHYGKRRILSIIAENFSYVKLNTGEYVCFELHIVFIMNGGFQI